MDNPNCKTNTGWGCLILIVIWFMLMLISGIGPGNFREAEDRSKIGRTRANQRTFILLTEEAIKKNSLDFMTHSYWGPMTQDIVAAVSLNPKGFGDEFNREGPFQLWSNGKGSFAVISRGPDKRLDLSRDMLDRLDQSQPVATRMVPLDPYCYDSTNGTRSAGDIIWLKWSDNSLSH